MGKKYLVRLTAEERVLLTELVNKGQAAAYKIKHANVLLKVDAGGPNWSDEQTARAGCSRFWRSRAASSPCSTTR